MSSTLRNVLNLANCLFTKSSQKDFGSNETYAQFIKLYSQLKLQDFNLQPSDFAERRSSPCGLAPLSYFEIFKNENFSLALFGFRGKHSYIPLHDHPSMHGFARCLHGSLLVQSYTALDEENIVDTPKNTSVKNLVPAIYLGEDIISEACSQVFTLTPTERNIHEVRSAHDQISVLADIISPPYTQDTDSYFYQVVKTCSHTQTNQAMAWLAKTKHALDYYCDSIPYHLEGCDGFK